MLYLSLGFETAFLISHRKFSVDLRPNNRVFLLGVVYQTGDSVGNRTTLPKYPAHYALDYLSTRYTSIVMSVTFKNMFIGTHAISYNLSSWRIFFCHTDNCCKPQGE